LLPETFLTVYETCEWHAWKIWYDNIKIEFEKKNDVWMDLTGLAYSDIKDIFKYISYLLRANFLIVLFFDESEMLIWEFCRL
jgi:hypothetical protein